MNEFDLVKTYFQKDPKHPKIIVGNGDDGAVFAPLPNQNLVISVDSVIAGQHVPLVCPPEGFASRLLGRGISDLAAMGARPEFLLLSLILPKLDGDWVKAFSKKFNDLAVQWGLELIGGDTSKGPLGAHLTAIGSTDRSNPPLTRNGSRSGDRLWLYGPDLGGARAYLDVLNNDLADNPIFSERYWRPAPQVDAGRLLVGQARAVIDVSDGLSQDLAHLLNASDSPLDAYLSSDRIPLCSGLVDCFGQSKAIEYALTGGDDYCLIAVISGTESAPIGGVEIGYLAHGEGNIYLDGELVPKHFTRGWDHGR